MMISEKATSVVTVNYERPDPELVNQAAQLLSLGELVVAPTETRYALLARADSDTALAKLYQVKERSTSAPSALFIQSIKELTELAEMTPEISRIAEKFLPGPLTMIVKCKSEFQASFGDLVSTGGAIGVRISSSPFIAELLKKSKLPLTATSANKSGAGERESIPEIESDLGLNVALYCDSGLLQAPVSTVVDFSGANLRILREGVISEKQIKSAL